MSAQTCADRGCCWDSSTGGIPWCFYAQAAPDNATAPGPTLRYAGAQSAPTVASLLGAGHAAIAGDAVAGVACLSFPPLAGECDFDFNGAEAAYSWPFGLAVDALPAALALEFTWLPHELRRAAATARGARVSTAARLSGGNSAPPLVLLEVNVSGGGAGALALALPMHFSRFGGTWDWGRPDASSDPTKYNVSLLAAGAGGAISRDLHSAAVAASAASSPTVGATLAWSIGAIASPGLPSGTAAALAVSWPAGADLSLNLALAVGAGSDSEVQGAAAAAAEDFAGAWAAAGASWEGVWGDAFGAGGSRFSGSLPVLPWPAAGESERGSEREPFDPAREARAAPSAAAAAADLSRAYYGGVVSMLQLLRNVSCAAGASGAAAVNCGYQLPTAAPVWAVTTSYLWDTSMVATTMALLEPAGFRAMIEEMLVINTHAHYAADFLSGTGVGPWYSFNDISVFTMLDRFGRAASVRHAVEAALGARGSAAPPPASGASDVDASFYNSSLAGRRVVEWMASDVDASFYNSSLAGRRVVEWMDSAATFFTSLPVEGGLADYGGASNLLECVPTYIHAVPSLNAANVGMLNRTAAIWLALGNASRAEELLSLAAALLPSVLATRVEGEGFFACVYPDGSRVPVRHVVDFFSIADAIAWALDGPAKTSMRSFLFGELATAALANTSSATNGTWMRALSLSDPAAPDSDRADHGPLGAYDGWPARASLGLAELGFAGDGVAFLAAAAGVLDEGPFGQAHRIFLDNVPRKAGGDGGQDALESVGGSFAEAALLLLAQLAAQSEVSGG